MSCLVLFSVLLALRLPRLGKRELVLVLFIYVCSICACLVLSVSYSSWCLGRAAVCDCDTSWTFLLTLFLVYEFRKIYACNDFSPHFRKIILRYVKIGYNIHCKCNTTDCIHGS